MEFRSEDQAWLSQLVLDELGIVVGDGKGSLLQARLLPVIRQFELSGPAELMSLLRAKGRPEVRRAVLDAMTTNETSFFRDPRSFDSLREQVLPQLLEARRDERALTIWVAASSSGQEAYSLAMLLHEVVPDLSTWRVRIVATDISSAMLERTRDGVYSQYEVNRGMPAPLLVQHFERRGAKWAVKEDLRRMVEVREYNLVHPTTTAPRADLVLLRNVLIYFDLPTRHRILDRARTALRPDGFLVVSRTESLLEGRDLFEPAFGGSGGIFSPLRSSRAGRLAS